jgi:hypothetical protein
LLLFLQKKKILFSPSDLDVVLQVQYIITELMTDRMCIMASVVTINRPDVVALIEALAARLTAGNKTEVVAVALRNLQKRESRSGSLFGAHPGSVTVREGVDLTAPILGEEMDAELAVLP